MASPSKWLGNCSLVERWKAGETNLHFHGYPDIPGVYSPSHCWNSWFGKYTEGLDLYLQTRNYHMVPMSISKPYAWGSLFAKLSVWSRSGNKIQKQCYWFKWIIVNKWICLGMVSSAHAGSPKQTPGSNWNPLKGPDDSGPRSCNFLFPSIPFSPWQLLHLPRTPASKWTTWKRNHGPKTQWSRIGSSPHLVDMWTCGSLGFWSTNAGESVFSEILMSLSLCKIYIYIYMLYR